MKTFRHHSPGPKRPALALYLSILAYFLLLLTLARLGFLVFIAGKISGQPLADIAKAFYIGFRFDARWAAILSVPAGLFLSLPLLRRLIPGWKKILLALYFLALAAIWLLYMVDAGFYMYLGERLNATIIELAEDTRDGLTMIWQSYPVVILGLAFLALTLLTFIPLKRIMAVEVREIRSKKLAAVKWLCGFLIFAVAAYGQLSSNLFPLRWSQAYFTPNPHITALALNPAQNLYDTYKAALKDDGPDLEAVREYYPLMFEYLGVDHPDIDTLDFSRRHQGSQAAQARPNVVVLILESFSWPKSSLAPGNSNHTPFMAKLAAESVYFPNFYANARTTARGVFSTLTGVPDVTESSTGSRNQRVIDQRIVANEFQGYEKYYMLGGNANWANIRGIIGNNIAGIHILEESFWKAPNVDVWGIHDYDLLMEASDLLAGLDGPFLAVIQTASFHKPFTIPGQVPFELETLDEETRVNYGFVSEAEYNAFRFLDHSLELFFQKAKEAGYYDNTIFLLFGDHGITESSPNTSPSYRAANLSPWHVPLVIHAPGLLQPQLRLDAASQADVFPTAAALAGLDYTNWTLGRDLFSEKVLQGGNAAFISGRNDQPIRLVVDDWCFVDNRVGGQFLYRLSDPEAVDYRELDPQRFEEMRALAWGYQVTAKYMLYHNKKNQRP